MALFGFDLNKAKGALQNAVKSVEQAAKDIDLNQVKGKVEEAAKSVGDAVKNIDLNQAKDKVVQTANNLIKKDKAEEKGTEEKMPEIKALSTRSALKIIYYTMAVDGTVFHNEEEKFDSIGNELDPDFAANKDKIIAECKEHMEKVIDPDDYYDVIQDGIEEALITSKPTEDSFITPKMLAWDVLTLAYSDENYDETERKLLKYIVRKTNIDKTVFLEMESSMQTLLDIERELAWVKTTNQPYLTIEGVINELTERKTVIMDSVKDLITL